MKLRSVFAALVVAFGFGASVFAQNNVPVVDISQDEARQVVIAQGTPEVYQGHPYLVKNPDDSMLLVWSINHGGPAGPIAKSVDGGLTWTRLDDAAPEGFKKHTNCPSIYRLVDADGHAWHWVFSSQPWLARIVSGDGGATWEEKAPIGFANVMAFSSIIPKNPGVQDGKYLGFYHRLRKSDGTLLNMEPRTDGNLEVAIAETDDAGFTWSTPRTFAAIKGKDLCEPCAIWSPDGKEIACVMRENTHKSCSMVCFSQDAGATWTAPQETSWELTGDRHIATYVDKDRLFIAFRDTAVDSPTSGDFVAWVGSYDDIKAARPGDYRVRLLRSYAKPWKGDCGYSGVALLKDGTLLALTYIKYKDDENQQSIVETRMTIPELDALADAAKEKK